MKKFSDILSAIFHPLLIPLFAFGLLFVFTYLNIMPIQYIAFVLSIVATFTLLAPLLFISLYKRMNHLSMEDLSERKKRFIPYILTMMSYATCLLTMYKMHFPYYFSSIIVAALMSLIICTLLNFRWKISIHLAGCGLLISGLIAYSFLFYFNPVWWLCGLILLSGFQGTARISYHQHTLFEIFAGFIVGMFCGIIGILFI
jgi:hypothetical protein